MEGGLVRCLVMGLIVGLGLALALALPLDWAVGVFSEVWI